jgi:hypothetical protein
MIYDNKIHYYLPLGHISFNVFIVEYVLLAFIAHFSLFPHDSIHESVKI